MSATDFLFGLWPAILAGVVAAFVPLRMTVRQRVMLGVIAGLAVASVKWLWPAEVTEAVAESAKAPEEWPHLLNLVVGLPLLGGVAVMFMPRQMLSLVRGFTLAVMGAAFAASLWLLTVPMTAGWHFNYSKDWMPALGIHYHVAVDGISLWLVLLATFITPIAAFASFGPIKTRVKEFCIALLLLEGAMLGAFVALDLFVFYLFWELMLVPMYLMIGIWGGTDRVRAALKFFIYTMVGSVLLLAAILYLVTANHKLTGQWSFDYIDLSRVVLSRSAQMLCFWAFSIAFFIKVPMWPLHTWLPDAHTEAPTGGSVILAAVLLKLGTYAYMRFSMGLFPGPASNLAANLAGIAVLGGVLYGALVAWKQQDVKRLVAYSSVAHLGYVMLGLFGATPSGMQGAVLQMVNHGISTGALFLLVGVLYDRRHTRQIEEFGGLAKVMPAYATLFLIVTFASIGVPGTNGFIGEFLVINGTFVSERLGVFGGIHTVGAAAGVVLAAVYMLGVVQKMFFGPVTNAKNQHLPDLTARETLTLAPLIVMIFVIGFFPGVFLDRMKDAIDMQHAQFKTVSGQAILYSDQNDAKLLPEDVFAPAFLSASPSHAHPPAALPAEGEPQAKNDAANGGAK